MRRLSGLFWVVVVLLAGSTNFTVKHIVQSLDDDLANTRRKTIAEQKQIHDLTAEWTYLNQPELLSDLNRRYVGLVPVAPKQIQHTIDDIPLRPAPSAPELSIDQVVAEIGAAPSVTPAPVAPTPIPAALPGPIVPVAATIVTRLSAAPVVIPTAPPRQPSLDALFAQIAGNR